MAKTKNTDGVRVCFYYEYKNIVGGLTSLLITLITELRKQHYEVIFFNYTDGLVAQELKIHGIEAKIIDLETINWSTIDQIIRSTDVLIITSFLEVFHRFLKVNPKILYYNINEDLPGVSKYKFGINPKCFARKLLEKLIKNNALLLMDDIGIAGTASELGFKLRDPKFLPVPVEVPDKNQYIANSKGESPVIRMTYIGRSVDWKMYPLKKILDDLSTQKIPNGKFIIFNIVVDDKKEFEKYVNVKDYKNSCIRQIVVHENILPSQINSFLLCYADVNFGMGTAALDSGKLGIPTIVMDSGRRPLPANYQYLWLYNAQQFYLGRNVDKTYTRLPASITMKELIAEHINTALGLQLHSNKTYNYVNETHSVKKIALQLYQGASQTSFRLRYAKPYVLFYSLPHRLIKYFWTKMTPGKTTSRLR